MLHPIGMNFGSKTVVNVPLRAEGRTRIVYTGEQANYLFETDGNYADTDIVMAINAEGSTENTKVYNNANFVSKSAAGVVIALDNTWNAEPARFRFSIRHADNTNLVFEHGTIIIRRQPIKAAEEE